jgi:hypothetical protein
VFGSGSLQPPGGLLGSVLQPRRVLGVQLLQAAQQFPRLGLEHAYGGEGALGVTVWHGSISLLRAGGRHRPGVLVQMITGDGRGEVRPKVPSLDDVQP